MTAAAEVSPQVGIAPVVAALGLSRATFYRRRQGPRARRARPASPRALTADEQQAILAVLHEPRFADQAPTEIYATLLEEGTYLCSIRTMYRLLAACGEVRERRNQLRHPAYAKPELLATGPNQVWSWDITKLKGPVTWSYFYLYVILDIFSRFVVGWMVARREAAALARRLIDDTLAKQHIAPGQLTLHADRGPSMRSKPVAWLLADLGVTKSHSRPHTSDDNPFSSGAVQDAEVPTRLSGTLWRLRGRADLLTVLLPLVQPRTPPQRTGPAHPRTGPLRTNGGRARPATGRAHRRTRGAS
jgi:putative transposase